MFNIWINCKWYNIESVQFEGVKCALSIGSLEFHKFSNQFTSITCRCVLSFTEKRFCRFRRTIVAWCRSLFFSLSPSFLFLLSLFFFLSLFFYSCRRICTQEEDIKAYLAVIDKSVRLPKPSDLFLLPRFIEILRRKHI